VTCPSGLVGVQLLFVVDPIPFWFTSTSTKKEGVQPHSALFRLVVLSLLDVVGFLARILRTQHRRVDTSRSLAEVRVVGDLESPEQAENRRRRRYPRGTRRGTHRLLFSFSPPVDPSTSSLQPPSTPTRRHRQHENLSTIAVIADGCDYNTSDAELSGGARDGRLRVRRTLV
jgi:hypothetical protein